MGKCRRLFQDLFGIAIARATSVRSLLKSATRAEPAYQEVRLAVQQELFRLFLCQVVAVHAGKAADVA